MITFYGVLAVVYPGYGQEIRMTDVMTAVGMPGSLGIAGLDAIIAYCEGKRVPNFRSVVALIERTLPAHQKDMVMRRYDKRYAEILGAHEKEQTGRSLCSFENIDKAKDPQRGNFWALTAKRIGYPGF
jgi:hypothetical protein